MHRLIVTCLLVMLAACKPSEPPSTTASPADSATAAMDALPDRPAQDSVRLEGDRYAMVQPSPEGERTVSVTLAPEGKAEFRIERANTPPEVTTGAWKDEGAALISTRFDEQEMMWRRTDDSLVALAYNVDQYGRDGLRLTRRK